MADRLGALDGSVVWASAPGASVTGFVPVSGAAAVTTDQRDATRAPGPVHDPAATRSGWL